ncbi:universal stress protein [Nonomuraea sp. C10]|uniref:universal stress protein n=1 Tax=Nonomuraea sp. C10 TaxID=2600577 RepID=UPI0011CDF628|nr:universal stress protein [Nonomuraea sp. C10]TXK40017.1 universal stress protein [Nonomuraea sp. C10]
MANLPAPFVLVGVNGSDTSKDALRWAARQAELTRAELHVIHAWRLPTSYGYSMDFSDADFAGAARKLLEQVADEVLGDSMSVPVTLQVFEGHPATVLIDAARDASLLVVGNRGHGPVIGTLLGSVALHCVHHAPCPVVVFRHPPDAVSPTGSER